MTDHFPIPPQSPAAPDQSTGLDSDGLAHAGQMETYYAETVAYARLLEQALADYQTATARGAEHIRMLEAELAKLQRAAIARDTLSISSGYEEATAYARHMEQVYAETTVYVHTLEKMVTEYQAASIRSADYVSKLESEISQMQRAYADATTYAHSLADYVHRLEIKIDDLEENLRQYQET
ncbi:MAG: hypothetical protein ACYDBJ_17430 [Aggregatilineales bacterium]